MSAPRYLDFVLALPLVLGLIGGCTSLPPLEGRPVSEAMTDTADTRLGRAITPRAAEHPGKSGIYPLDDSREAFAARMLLAQAADRTLDIQYYIWQNDISGTLLLEALHDAAERGVRVRLLLDDNNTAALDETLATLDSHSNIEIRLFNPFAIRSPRWLGYLTDFSRLNRRMHNKSFTADNQVTIIGGRNVGDEYFGATENVAFVDLDVIAVGPVVSAVSQDFDRYWVSASAYPVNRLLAPSDAARLEQLSQQTSLVERDPAAQAYVQAVRESPFVQELLEGQLPLEWAITRMVSDDPAKALGQATAESSLTNQLRTLLGRPKESMALISAYFVPTKAGTEAFAAFARDSVKVRVLTNALEATDVPVVHAGYAKRRKALLEAGVTLYELKLKAATVETNKSAGPFGSSGASLHAKTFSVDGARVFIGSFNFDPRSARLNTELGFVIEAPGLARRIEEAFDRRIPEGAYEVRLSDEGQLYWMERRDGGVIRHSAEPGTTFWERAWIQFVSMLPIEWLL